MVYDFVRLNGGYTSTRFSTRENIDRSPMLSGKVIHCQSEVLNTKSPNYHNIPHAMTVKAIPIYTICERLYIFLVTTKNTKYNNGMNNIYCKILQHSLFQNAFVQQKYIKY